MGISTASDENGHSHGIVGDIKNQVVTLMQIKEGLPLKRLASILAQGMENADFWKSCRTLKGGAMPIALWTDEYEMGVEGIDAEHIVIFSLINHVDEAIGLENNEKAIQKIFKVLIRHAIAHFQSEEALMIKHAYPHTEGHIEEHHQIVEKLQSLFLAYEENPATDISCKIVEVLANWANIHVLQTDLLFRDFLQKPESQSRPVAL